LRGVSTASPPTTWAAPLGLRFNAEGEMLSEDAKFALAFSRSKSPVFGSPRQLAG
jgi:hypothetical protein